MMRSMLLMAATCALAATQADTVDIKVPSNKPGDVARVTKHRVNKVDIVANVNGNEQKKTDASEEKYVYVETVIEKPDPKKKLTKATRAYEVAELIKDGKKTTHSFEKKTLTVEKKDGKYTFTVDGKPLAGAELKILEKEFADDEDKHMEGMLPGKPVKVGDTWPIEAAKIFSKKTADNPFTIDAEKTKGSGKLIKTGAIDGHPTGVIEYTATIPVTAMKFGPNTVNMKDSALTMKTNMEFVIDGSTPYGSGTIEITFDLNSDLPGGNTMTIKGTETETRKAEKVK